jgi:hypothetical protein
MDMELATYGQSFMMNEIVFHGWIEHTNAIMGGMNKMAWIKSILKSEIDHDGI